MECGDIGPSRTGLTALARRRESVSTAAAKKVEETPVIQPGPVEESEVTTTPKTFPQSPSYEYLQTHWKDFTQTLKGVGPRGALNGFLNSAPPAALDGETLILSCNNKFVKDTIEKVEYKRLIEEKLQEVFGSPKRIQCKIEASAIDGHLVREVRRMGGVVVNKEKRDG